MLAGVGWIGKVSREDGGSWGGVRAEVSLSVPSERGSGDGEMGVMCWVLM